MNNVAEYSDAQQLCQLTVATTHSCQVHDYAARLHDSHGILLGFGV